MKLTLHLSWLLICGLLLHFVEVRCALWAGTQHLDFSTVPWAVSGADKEGNRIEVPVAVPFDIYSALQEANVIEDPYVGRNAEQQDFVRKQVWHAATTISAATVERLCVSVANGAGAAILHVDGVQTFASVALNGVEIARTTSMFYPQTLDVTSVLCDADPAEGMVLPASLSITLNATSSTAQQLAVLYEEEAGQAFDAPSYPFGLPNRNMARSTQASFGWDWAPAISPVAIRGPLTLSALPGCAMGGLTVQPRLVTCRETGVAVCPDPSSGLMLAVNVSFYLPWECRAPTATLGLSFGESRVRAFAIRTSASYSLIQRRRQYSARECWAAGVFNVTGVELWWPRDLGRQRLYNMTARVELRDDAGSAFRSASASVLYGFRCVSLATTQRGAPALALHVNGQPVFSKGANVIPPDLLVGRKAPASYAERLASLIDDAIRLNANMLRVWGGGEYLPSEFYAACDAAGVMVWQEMMFACAEYPAVRGFLELAETEVEWQVRRLMRHPSVVLWSGNNEDGEAYDDGPDSNYQRLNTDVVLRTIARTDDTRPVWPSSPSPGFLSGMLANGLPDNAQPIVTRPRNETDSRGDTHYYNYSSCADAPRPTLFASEYGFQGLAWADDMMPDMRSPEDIAFNGSFMAFRQRHWGGAHEMLTLIRDVVGLPRHISESMGEHLQTALSSADFAALSMLSQVQQAYCMRRETEAYRRGRRRGAFPTMGALFWQLNAAWSSPSWTAVDYRGASRVLFSDIAEAFHPLALSLDDSDGPLQLDVSNDLKRDIRGTVAVDMFRKDGSGRTITIAIDVAAGAGLRVDVPEEARTWSVVRACWSSGSPCAVRFGTKLRDVALEANPDCAGKVLAVALDVVYVQLVCRKMAVYPTVHVRSGGVLVGSSSRQLVAAGEAVQVQVPVRFARTTLRNCSIAVTTLNDVREL